MLAMHPEYQEIVYKELLDVVPSKDADLTPDMLNKLKFLDLCIRESLRILPTVPLIGRNPIEPIKLGDVVIPANTPIVIGIKQIQIREEYWGSDAKSFNPYRFEKFDRNKVKENQCAYMPFSYGPRNCIGKEVWTRLIYSSKSRWFNTSGCIKCISLGPFWSNNMDLTKLQNCKE